MKKITILLVCAFIASTSLFAQTKAGKTASTKETISYTCPHHPEVMANQPGNCTKCGMKLTLSPKEAMKKSTTKNYTCPVHSDIVTHDAGQCPKCGRRMNISSKEQMKAEVTKLYTCPMHPAVALTKDGVCPKCGEALVEKKDSKPGKKL